MIGLQLAAYALGGAALTNAVPHVISGLSGRPFQTPFAKPAGVGLSSSTLNLLWGFANAVVGYALVYRVGRFDLRDITHVVAFGLGGLMLGLMLARHFGRLHGGDMRT